MSARGIVSLRLPCEACSFVVFICRCGAYGYGAIPSLASKGTPPPSETIRAAAFEGAREAAFQRCKCRQAGGHICKDLCRDGCVETINGGASS